jgi:hypothetical protein
MPDTSPAMADSVPLDRQSVRHRIGTVSVMPPECCPPSLRNRVRHGPAHARIMQQTLGGFEKDGKTTRRAQFPSGRRVLAVGRPALGAAERTPRVYLLQLWFNPSDPAVEAALGDSVALRCLAGIDLGRQPAQMRRHVLTRHLG